MAESVMVAVADLLLDEQNPRLKELQEDQQATLLAIAKKDPQKFLSLAQHITDHHLDPLGLCAVVATGDQRKRYRVLEGNRRVAALKALETPSLVAQAFDEPKLQTLKALADKYKNKPVNGVPCALFDNEEEARRWIELRHTGENEGAGLVPWGADEKDRWSARRGKRQPAGQVLDFVKRHGRLSPHAYNSTIGIFTSIKRLINTPAVRERLGIDLQGGEVVTWFPAKEVVKGLTKMVEDLLTEKIKVKDIYDADDRARYARASLKREYLPNPAKRFQAPRLLKEASTGGSPLPLPYPSKRKRGRRRRKGMEQATTLIPPDCQLNIDPPRINLIYRELADMSVDSYPNACSVTLRVFVELSVDHYLAQKGAMSEDNRRNSPLAKRLKMAASHLHGTGKIDAQMRQAVDKVADGQHGLAASIPTFHLYVHNQYAFPKPSELRTIWTELQPLLERLWP